PEPIAPMTYQWSAKSVDYCIQRIGKCDSGSAPRLRLKQRGEEDAEGGGDQNGSGQDSHEASDNYQPMSGGLHRVIPRIQRRRRYFNVPPSQKGKEARGLGSSLRQSDNRYCVPGRIAID